MTNGMTIAEAVAALKSKKVSAAQLTEQYLERIKVKNPESNAYLEVFDDALDQAKEADKKLAEGESLPDQTFPPDASF